VAFRDGKSGATCLYPTRGTRPHFESRFESQPEKKPVDIPLDSKRPMCNQFIINVIFTSFEEDQMVRTQIQLTEEQAQRLKELSAANRESMAALIRKAVDQFLVSGNPDRASLYRQAQAVVGKFTAGTPDIANEHDRYLEEAFK